jgi:hypothetical protein
MCVRGRPVIVRWLNLVVRLVAKTACAACVR